MVTALLPDRLWDLVERFLQLRAVGQGAASLAFQIARVSAAFSLCSAPQLALSSGHPSDWDSGISEIRECLDAHRSAGARGWTEQARGDLLRTYGWFTEGFDTDDLQEARKLG